MRSLRLVAASVAALAIGCASSRPFVCPTRGGPPWLEVSSEHYVLRTDLAEADARALVREMEAIRATLLAAIVGRDVATPGRIEVVAFRSAAELFPFTRQQEVRGLAWSGDFGERRILLAESPDGSTRRLVAHELAHIVSAYAVPQQPRWYAEGLATLLEGLGDRAGSATRSFGSPPILGPEFVASAVKVPVRDAMEWRQASWLQEDLYARSYALVHFLYTQRRPGFDALTVRLARLEGSRTAWNAVFPEWSLEVAGATDALDVLVTAHARRAFASITVAAPAGDPALGVRSLSPAEVHGVRLELPHRWTAEVERAEIEEALREDAGNVAALAARVRRGDGDAVALARAAAAAHPEDPAAWELLGAALPESSRAERIEALRRAVGAAPQRVRALLLLAAELGASGDVAEASAFTGRALEAAPWSANALLLHGHALAALGRCEEAVPLGWRAVEVAFHAGPDAHRWAGDGVGRIEAACAERREAERARGADAPKPPAPAAPARGGRRR